MTAREFYEAVLIEVTAKGAPELLIDEFNYYFNKGQYSYVNKRYNAYDINQQTTDDLQVLKGTEIYSWNEDPSASDIKAVGETRIANVNGINKELQEAIYTLNLPKDYFHLLSCLVEYTLQEDFKCYDQGYKFQFPTKRMTSDMYANIMTNAWLKPHYKRPYHFVQNNERSIVGEWANSSDHNKQEIIDIINKEAGVQIGHNAYEDVDNTDGYTSSDNLVGPKLEINYGKDNSIFKLTRVILQYLKVPQLIRLTPEQLDSTVDYSQVLEYPEYVCQEVIKETVKLIMYHNADPKLQAYDPVNTSVNPTPGQVPPQQQAE